ncbi:MAG: dihydrofolate reductase [Bacteroides sp.]
MPTITLIAAIDRNYAIGNKNQLLYRLPNDLKRFKELTTGHTLIMGRKTFESLPKGALPHRRNIVLSKTLTTAYPNTELFESLETALKHCASDEKVFVMGGERVYKDTLALAHVLELTEIDSEVKQADAYFPVFDKKEWIEQKRITHPADDKHAFDFYYVTYVKKTS